MPIPFYSTGIPTPLSIARGGTGSTTQNFVDLTSNQASIGGIKTFTSTPIVPGLTNSGNETITGWERIGSSSTPTNTTAGDLTIGRLAVGNGVSLGGSAGRIGVFYTDASTGSTTTASIATQTTLNPAADSANEQRGIYIQNIFAAPSNNQFTAATGQSAGYFENRLRSSGLVAGLIGFRARGLVVDSSSTATVTATTITGADIFLWARPSGTTTGTITTGIGYDTTNLATDAGLTATTLIGFRMVNPGANTITSLYGLDIAALTRGSTNNIGLRIAAPSGATNNYALQLSDTGAGPNGGITFSTDVQIWRSSSATLSITDGASINTGTTTGFKIGTSTGQKIGFFNKTPVVQQGPWTLSGVTPNTTFNASTANSTQTAQALGTLIQELQALGLVG